MESITTRTLGSQQKFNPVNFAQTLYNPKMYDERLAKVKEQISESGVEGFVTFLQKRKKKNGDKLIDSTIERYSDIAKRYKQTLFKSTILSNTNDFLTFLNQEISEVNTTVIYAAFKSFIEYLGFDKQRDSQIFNYLWHPKVRANASNSIKFLQQKVLSRQELRHFFLDEKDEWLRCAYSFSYDTACRRSELFKVEWRDIMFYNFESTKYVMQMSQGVYGELQLHGKGGKMRKVHLHKMTVDMLLHWREKCLPMIEKNEGKVKVFQLFKQSGGLYKQQDHEFYKRMIFSSELIMGRSVHPHCFRHTKLTHMADNGCDVLGIMSYAGHADITTSMIYIHISSFKGTRAFMEFSQPLLDDAIDGKSELVAKLDL